MGGKLLFYRDFIRLFREDLWLLKEPFCFGLVGRIDLSSFTTDSASKLDVFWHDGHSLGVDGAQVGVLKETDEVSFACFLKGHDG